MKAEQQVRTPASIAPLAINAHAPFDAATFFKTFRHARVQVNGIRLHYVIGGEGTPVVLLNGFPQTWYAWRKIMPALAQQHTVIAVDVRGTGDSEKPPSGYDAHTVAEDIHQLAQQLEFTTLNLVAYDITGRVGYAYAAMYPEQVSHLVLMETLLPGFGLEEAMNVATGGSYHFGFHANVDVATWLVQGKEREYLKMMMQGSLYDKAAIADADFEEYIRWYILPGGMRGGFEHYRAFLEDAEPNRVLAKQKLKMPVLALYGAASGDTKVLPETLLAVAEDVQGEGIEGSGHFIAEERPDYLAARLLDFFAF